MRLYQLQEYCGIDPIIGLLHHGSGPRFTASSTRDFPQLFSEYARAVAECYPWANHFTPINEPLTTARFSALYGFWYPHHRSDRSLFRRFSINAVESVLAMREIRRVNPSARLVQTEDLARVFSTPALNYQADFENERRWLTYDLLCGRVDRHHPLWGFLGWTGVPESEFAWFLDNPCEPDIFGLNYYVTSDRFLDERINHYPEHSHGCNGRDVYADVEAIRVNDLDDWGPEARIREAWDRYRRPIAVTEAHLGCDDEAERSAWLCEVWNAALKLRESGADIRAVTVWALFGSYDWNCLLQRCEGITRRESTMSGTTRRASLRLSAPFMITRDRDPRRTN